MIWIISEYTVNKGGIRVQEPIKINGRFTLSETPIYLQNLS